MYICICKSITEQQIRHAIHQGAGNLADVSRRLGVATQCGKCGKFARQLVRQTLTKAPLAAK
jgi:bacterioferritin-associated ferredoxin